MAGRQIKGQGGRRERLLTPHDLAGIVTAQQGFVTGPIDYNSLINKPVIPFHLTDLDTTVSGVQLNSLKTKVDGIQAGAQVNVQSDWNAISGDAFIVNKPTIPAAQVNSDWNAVSGIAQILNKPTALPPNGPAGGGLTGTYPNPGVIVPVSSVFGRTGAVVAATNDYSFNQISGLIIPQGYIDGLQMVWNSATSISVTSGTAYIPSLGNVLVSNSTLTLSGLSLAASTWYHIYLYSNAGVPTIECVTTAPVLYYGTAYQKTGDNTRRYLGSVRTQVAGANIIRFDQAESNHVMYMESINNDGLHVITGGTATVSTTVSCAATVPVTSKRAQMYVENSDTIANSSVVFIAIPPLAPSTNLITFVRAQGRLSQVFLTDASQNFNYQYNAAPVAGAGFDAWVLGYYYQR